MGAAKTYQGPSVRLVVVIGFLIRLGFFFTPGLDFIPLLLERRCELSTPISSFMALKEAIYLQRLNRTSIGILPKPYQSGTLYIPPIFLALFEPFLFKTDGNEERFNVYSALLWSLTDSLTAIILANIFSKKRNYLKRIHASPDQAQLDTALLSGSILSSAGGVAAFYLFNPFTIATCLARSTSALNNLALAFSVNAALTASPLLLSIGISLAISISLYPILLVPSLVLLCSQNAISATTRRKPNQQRWSRGLALFCLLLIFGALGGISYTCYLITGNDWTFIQRAYGTILLVPDLSPNIGLWWYFFIEIFDHFRDFFLLAFNVHVASYSIPLTIKFRQDPLFTITALSGLTAVLKSYPTLGDAAIFLSFLSLHREIFPYFRHTLLTSLLYILASFMMPALHHLWLIAGSGNANFFYASNLVWALAGGSAVLDALWAWGRWRWESERIKITSSTDWSQMKEHVQSIGDDVLLRRKVVQA